MDPDGDDLTFRWEQLDGPEVVTLQDADAATPSFTPALQGVYKFGLVVSDGRLDSAFDEVRVDIERNEDNRPPEADAGMDQNVSLGEDVVLDGSTSSDPEGDPLTVLWTQTDGPVAIDLVEDAETNTFTARIGGLYVFELVVSDGLLSSQADKVIIEVKFEDTPDNNPDSDPDSDPDSGPDGEPDNNPDPPVVAPPSEDGCGCTLAPGTAPGGQEGLILVLFGMMALVLRRRR